MPRDDSLVGYPAPLDYSGGGGEGEIRGLGLRDEIAGALTG